MRRIAASMCAVFAITTLSCGKGSQPKTAKPVQQGRLEEWLRDPTNYKPFFYNEKQKPGSTKAEFRYLVTKTPTSVAVPELSADYSVDSDIVIVLRAQNKYQAFIATYLNCADATLTADSATADASKALAPAASSDNQVLKTTADLAQAAAVKQNNAKQTNIDEGTDGDTAFFNAASTSKTRVKRGVLIGYQELGADGGGLNWNTNSNRLNLLGLGTGSKTLVGKRDLTLNLTFDDAMKKSGFTSQAFLSIRRHVKSYEEFHAGPTPATMKLADAEARVKKDCSDVDAEVFKFEALPKPNPTPGPTPVITHRPAKPPPPTPVPPKTAKRGGHA